VISEESTDSAARAAMLDGLIAAELATKKPLRIEVSGVSNAYWQFSNATVKSHKPKRLLGYDTPANVTQYDFSATGLTKGIKIAKVAVVGDSIIAATSDAPGSPYFITQFLGNGWPAQMKARCQRKIEIARNSLTGKFDHGIGGIKAEGFMVGGTYRTTFLDAINSDADTILICVGANDMNVTANSTAAANIISLWDEVIAAGKTLIAVAIPPTRTSRPSGDEAAWKAAQVATNAILSATITATDTWIQCLPGITSTRIFAGQRPSENTWPRNYCHTLTTWFNIQFLTSGAFRGLLPTRSLTGPLRAMPCRLDGSPTCQHSRRQFQDQRWLEISSHEPMESTETC
jgi:lysophospholipase L1-like esterase